MSRKQVFAGQFYESDPQQLKERISWCFRHPLGPGEIPKVSHTRRKCSIGYMVPHAGYIYSGPIAVHTYYSIAKEGKPEAFVLIGPNHTGIGASVAIWHEGYWETPFGRIMIDDKFANEMLKESRFLEPDTAAHLQEHSLEVQLPFLQYLFENNDFKIVPVTMLYQTPETAKDLANSIIKAIEKTGRDVIIIATSDMTHYEPHELAVKKDMMAIDRILKLDPEGLYSTVIQKDITMCGVGPIMTLIYVSKHYGTAKAELLKHATSGDVTGDKSWVVGYASVRFYKSL